MIRAVVILNFVVLSVFGADPKYPVSEIPEDLKKGNYAVVRESISQFNILAKNKSSHYVRQVITILNANGKRLASQYIFYDQLRKVSFVKAALYDANGQLIRKLKSNEIIDQSAYDGFSLYSDNRIKKLDLTYSSYPYTIEFEYEVEMKYLYSIPRFVLYEDDEVSIEKSSYIIKYVKGLKPRYKLFKIDEPNISIEGDKEVLSWTFKNIKPSKWEKWGPDILTVVPNILAGPADFDFDGYAGNMESWESLGRWQIVLNQNRDVLPEATKQKVRELAKGITNTEEKIKALYHYLQSKTRYVSIQRGIGGYQPFEAKTVDQLGYGDCKALSNYMVSMLKEAGIIGYYTWIYAGQDYPKVSEDFAIDYFNHIIVAVPLNQDTIWLECTSQTNPFGYLGKSTADRHALMITENGGKLVRTPSYAEDLNIQSRTAHVTVQRSGDATAKVKTTYTGLQYEEGSVGYYADVSYEDQKKWVQKNTAIPTFDINSFSIKNKKDKAPAAFVELDLNLKKLATITGKRIFLTPNLMNRSTFIPEKVEARKTNIVRKMGYTDFDTIYYHIPEEIYPEFLPEPVNIKTRFGEYEAQFKIEQGSLVYIRKIKMLKGDFPPEAYSELVEFYKSINKADNVKLVFLNKT